MRIVGLGEARPLRLHVDAPFPLTAVLPLPNRSKAPPKRGATLCQFGRIGNRVEVVLRHEPAGGLVCAGIDELKWS